MSHWLCDSCRLLFIFRLRNSSCPKCYTGFMKLRSSPFNSVVVFSYCSWTFFTFNHNSCPFLYSFFFLKVWKSLSKIYRQTFALIWVPSTWFTYVLILMDPPLPPKCKGNNWMPPKVLRLKYKLIRLLLLLLPHFYLYVCQITHLLVLFPLHLGYLYTRILHQEILIRRYLEQFVSCFLARVHMKNISSRNLN